MQEKLNKYIEEVKKDRTFAEAVKNLTEHEKGAIICLIRAAYWKGSENQCAEFADYITNK